MTEQPIVATAEPDDDPECTAVVRRNLIDGHLYACGSYQGDAIHGSIEACSALMGRECDKPDEHHAFEARQPAAVPS